ncbi:MAG TPA: xanthine dehydrogenase family protein subunit M [Hyphomicrobium sp.]|uniref:FAD binding domain-containing protein n=1 Tax=Hyphomicrobium sp. TaxID=82 RepID=UPI002BE20111|nr:xanthine dehydrogenase family protein subunit M [Hyphomicrobium sp.]HXE01764.1 xanthine dehydrogenase family protein subunit M [Hyphomicrobium sp.]
MRLSTVMKPAAFDYVIADSIDMAVASLADGGGDAKIIAGGQSLVPMLNFRLIRPSVLIDINRIGDLAFIEEAGKKICVGALTRHYQIETSPVIARHLPVLASAMTHVAHLAIRNRGTIGGSLSHADPAAELPMMALLLDAELHIASASGKRTIAARDFFVGALTVDLARDDIVTEIALPKLPPKTGWGFEEVARRSGDFALAAAAATLTLSAGVISQARIALTGVGPTPVRVAEAEALLVGQALEPGLIDRIIDVVRAAIEPETDLHASSDYRRHLASVLVGRAVSAAWRRANESAT